MILIRISILGTLFITLWNCGSRERTEVSPKEKEELHAKAALVSESLQRCRRFTHAWLSEADTTTGLIPRNLEKDRDIWNAKDAAADNYPFMVLTSALTDDSLFNGRMLDMLDTETELTSRLGAMPDTYSFSKKGFVNETIHHDDIVFGSSEYVKDGLLPLTEWMGISPWSERMLAIMDAMWDRASIPTPRGNITSTNPEVNGEMLQILSRIYWMTGKEKYLDYAVRLGDYYLLDGHHPTQDFVTLRLRDHGCEIVSGLCELYATLSYAQPEKRDQYREALYRMLDRILEIGRNEDGLFYNVVNPQTGEILDSGIADNFGYTLNGFYTIYLLDSIESYHEATLKALRSLDTGYKNYDWENGSADGYADAIEGALNLYNREPVTLTADWIDSEIQVMWNMQQPSGIIEGWHGDGNFARTTIMYALWKSQGVYLKPFRSDLRWGATTSGDTLNLLCSIDEDWNGKIHFDYPRHKGVMQMPLDWPRINQFPEWFVVDADREYQWVDGHHDEKQYTGTQLRDGIPVSIASGEELVIQVYPDLE